MRRFRDLVPLILKVSPLHGCFSRFLYCTNGTKLRKASYINTVSSTILVLQNGLISIIQGDLGSIDKKYDIAISTACGPLDFIVCDTMDTAQRGVEFLKHNRIGSTTFIALDKVHFVFCEQELVRS